MLKINFDFDELLGDIISFNGLYIDFLDCNEYTIWYLIRQAGIKSFLPVLNTKAFYNNKLKIDEIGFGIYRDLNLKEIKNKSEIKIINKFSNISFSLDDTIFKTLISYDIKATNIYNSIYYKNNKDLVKGPMDFYTHPIYVK